MFVPGDNNLSAADALHVAPVAQLSHVHAVLLSQPRVVQQHRFRGIPLLTHRLIDTATDSHFSQSAGVDPVLFFRARPGRAVRFAEFIEKQPIHDQLNAHPGSQASSRSRDGLEVRRTGEMQPAFRCPDRSARQRNPQAANMSDMLLCWQLYW